MEDVSDVKLTPRLETLTLSKITDEVYFSKQYADYISNSRLGFLNPDQGGSPEKFIGSFAANRLFSSSLTLGSAIHEMQLQPELFEFVPHVVNPGNKPGFIADEVYNMCKSNYTDKDIIEAAKIVDYYHGELTLAQLEDVKSKIHQYIIDREKYESVPHDKTPIYLDTKSQEKFIACMKAMNENRYIQNLLHPTGILEDPISENEQAILLTLDVQIGNKEPFQVKLKSKLDNYTIDKENNKIIVNDIKTHGKILPEFPNSIERYQYNREISMYSYLLCLCAKQFYGMDNPTVEGNFLVVSTIPNYYTKVFKMTRPMFESGFASFKYLLKYASKVLCSTQE